MLPSLNAEGAQRVETIKQSLLANHPGICTERARYYTEGYRRWAADPVIIRRAKSLRLYLQHKTIHIGSADLIPGYLGTQPRWAPVYPEYSWDWLYEELECFAHRSYDRFSISPEAKRELQAILPEWRGRTLYERIANRQPPVVQEAVDAGVMDWKGQATSGEGHIVVSHEIGLSRGFAAIIDEAREKREALALHEPHALNQRDFYEAVEIAYDGAILYAARLAEVASQQASVCVDTKRRMELEEMAAICQRIPAHAATSFREALYMVWLIHLIQQIESNGHSVSLGRFDQYVYPYFQRDLQTGQITEDQALELVQHFYLKLFSVVKVRPEGHSRTQSGYPMYQNLVVGGQTKSGEDATNALTYVCLAAHKAVQLSEPNLYVRCHQHTPPELWDAALEVVQLGSGMPAFVNDQIIVASLKQRGVAADDALNYSTMGCLEVQVPGRWGHRANGKSKLNVLKVLELTLNGGYDPRTKRQLTESGNTLGQFPTFASLYEAWQQQSAHYVNTHIIADNINDKALEEMVPNAFCSALVWDCLARGQHINEGGAYYDMTSGALVGVPNVGNALATLKQIVFDEQLITAEQLADALAANFAGDLGEQIRLLCANRVAKFGEDNDHVDALTASVIADYDRFLQGKKNMRYGRGPLGGGYYPSTLTISSHVPAGKKVGATPDGRRGGEPTADGVSPSRGSGLLGPTAVLRSVSKLPTILVTGGQLLNLRIDPKHLTDEQGKRTLANLIKAFFALDGWHIQLNTVSTEVLRSAQQDPEQHRDLMVRVAGYSAPFTALDPELQEDIIQRIEHRLDIS